MESKGVLYASGRINPNRSHDPEAIATLGYKETRYNLVRMYVVREWVAHHVDGTRFSADTRREVVAATLAHHHATTGGTP